MKLSKEYIVCDIMDEVYLLPEAFNKKDFGKVKKLTDSASLIIKEISSGISSEELLVNKICDIYEAEGEERECIQNSIHSFISTCIQNGYLEA